MNFKKQFSNIFLLLTSLTIINCSVVEDEIKQEHQKFEFKKLNAKEIKSNNYLYNKLNSIKPDNKSLNRTIFDNNNNLLIDLEQANYVFVNNLHYYTFSIITTNNNIQNLLLISNNNSTFNAFKLDYHLTNLEYSKIAIGFSQNSLYQNLEIIPLQNFSTSGIFQRGSTSTCYAIETICYVKDDNPNGHVYINPTICLAQNYNLVEIPCISSDASGGGGGGFNNGGDVNLTPNPLPNNPPTGGSSSEPYIVLTPISFNNFSIDNICGADFISSILNDHSKASWINYQPNALFNNILSDLINTQENCEQNSVKATNIFNLLYNDFALSADILNYSEANGNSVASRQFVEEALNYILEGGIINFPLKIFIDQSFKNNPCLKGIYDNMVANSPLASNYLKNFDSNMSVSDLMFAGDDTMSSDTNAQTSPPVDKLIKITFNTNNLNRPKLSIARTFIHELIHAEIFRKLLSISNHSSINLTNNDLNLIKENFPGIFDYYVRFKFNVPAGQILADPQHQMMAQHYRTIISNAIKEFDQYQHPQNIYDSLAWVGLMGEGNINMQTGLTSNPTVAWLNLSQTVRLDIINTVTTFESNNTNCQ